MVDCEMIGNSGRKRKGRGTYLLLKPVELNYTRVPLHYLDLEALGSPAPLCATNIALVQGESVTTAEGFPSKAILGKPALPGLFGKIQKDVVKTLAKFRHCLLVNWGFVMRSREWRKMEGSSTKSKEKYCGWVSKSPQE